MAAAEMGPITLYTLGKKRSADTEVFTILMDNGMGAMPLWNTVKDAERFIEAYQPGNDVDVLPVDPPGLVRSLQYLMQHGVGYLALSPVAVDVGAAQFTPMLTLEFLADVEGYEMEAAEPS